MTEFKGCPIASDIEEALHDFHNRQIVEGVTAGILKINKELAANHECTDRTERLITESKGLKKLRGEVIFQMPKEKTLTRGEKMAATKLKNARAAKRAATKKKNAAAAKRAARAEAA